MVALTLDRREPLVRPPRQERSQKTLENISNAIIALLAHREYEDITIAEITAEAGVTAGAFYTRFVSKEAALEHLVIDRLENQLEGARAFFNADDWKQQDLKKRVEILIDILVAAVDLNPGLARALALRATVRPYKMSENERRLRGQASDILEQWLGDRRSEIKSGDPQLRIKFLLDMIRSVINTQLIFPVNEKPFDAKFVAAQLNQAAVSYIST